MVHERFGIFFSLPRVQHPLRTLPTTPTLSLAPVSSFIVFSTPQPLMMHLLRRRHWSSWRRVQDWQCLERPGQSLLASAVSPIATNDADLLTAEGILYSCATRAMGPPDISDLYMVSSFSMLVSPVSELQVPLSSSSHPSQCF